jgi:putative heme-binding domain-containing protein
MTLPQKLLAVPILQPLSFSHVPLANFQTRMTKSKLSSTVSCWSLLPLFLLPFSLRAQTPAWIWDPASPSPKDGEVRYFQTGFQAAQTVAKAVLTAAADNHFIAYLNGQRVSAGDAWEAPVKADVTKAVQKGNNLLAIEARNDSGVAGLLVKLDLTYANGKRESIVTSPSWKVAAQEQTDWNRAPARAPGWVSAKSLGKLGVSPWGDVLAGQPGGSRNNARSGQATPAESLTVLPGFKVELLHSATGSEGSWVCLTLDNKGRLIISPQDARQHLLRYTLDHDGHIAKTETIDLGVGEAMGLLYAFDSLYANSKGPKGTGLYRLQDTDSDDQFDKLDFLKTIQGGGEHGPHGLVLGPDNMIYMVNGNHTKVPDGLSPQSPHQGYAEDQLLPRDWDGNGHARGILAPGGQILRTDRDGKNWELVLAGFRNTYDFDFNADGEIFGYDSDMEWDWGLPWYRPTAVYHCVSGGDYGWRSGTGKGPWYYPDALPPVWKVGVGSPTGVRFGKGAKFPGKYQRALYVMDWTYGRLLAIHLTPEGASYRGVMEPFVVGKPLNLTDLVIGKDGAIYFTTGGRGTQSGLYRVTYTGPESTAPVPLANAIGSEARALRHKLEAFHGRQDPAAVDFLWPHLNSPDRFIRYAARIALESQPVSEWRNRALAETNLNASLTALLALARKGSREAQDDLFESLGRYWPNGLNEDQKIAALRIAGLACVRMGRPDSDQVLDLTASVDPLYPAASERLNRELCRFLVYLEAPNVVAKTLDLIEKAPTQEEQIHYIVALRTLKNGWTLDQRKRYFSWFNRSRAGLKHPADLMHWFADVGRDYSDGASFPKYIANFKREAMDTLTESERTELAGILKGVETEPIRVSTKQLTFVKDWKLEDLLPLLDQVSRRRSYDKGRESFIAAQCVACHKFGNEGGATGQELTALSSRYTLRDIVESILDPSKVISEQYQFTTFFLKNGDDVTGKVVDEKDGKLVILVNPINDVKVEVAKADVQTQAPSKVSPMPEGLINVLNQEEILDLLAFLQSGGRRDQAAFR